MKKKVMAVTAAALLAILGIIGKRNQDVYDADAFSEIVFHGESEVVLDGVAFYESDRYVYRKARQATEFRMDGLECLSRAMSVDSNEQALVLAKDILRECREKDGGYTYYGRHILDSIIHLTQENVWIFRYYCVEDPNKPYARSEGGGMTIVIDGKQGVLLQAYIEE